MTPLRQRFIEDMQRRNYSPKTVKAYVAGVLRFARYFGRSPATLGAEHIRTYQLYLLRENVTWSLYNQTVCALRFLYRQSLNQPELGDLIPYGKKSQTLPSVLSPEEVLQFLDAATPGRERTLFRTAYACGCAARNCCISRSATSTAHAWSSRSARAKDAKTASSRCRRVCWKNCGPTGCCSGPRCGCSRATNPSNR